MTTSINGRQLYDVFINHYRGSLLWNCQTWHASTEEAIAYGRKMAAYHYADEPVSAIRVSAALAA